MPIILNEHVSTDGMSQFVAVIVEDFADDSQIRQIIDLSCEVLNKIKGSKQQWLRKEDCCYRVIGGLLKKNGGKLALDKVAKALMDAGYREIERKIVDTRKRT